MPMIAAPLLAAANYPLLPHPKSASLPSIAQAIPELRLATSPGSSGLRLYPPAERPTSGHKPPTAHRQPTADDNWRSQAGRPGRSPVFGSQPNEYSIRYNSISASSARSEERSPFAPTRYSISQHDGGRYNDMGDMGYMSGNTKQRKRRGNLPKKTTEILRAWLVTHLQCPYPTEDEKQVLMRLTGLQMNQISNWFINARRRLFPAMINNARAETDMTHSRAATDGASIGNPDGSGMDSPGIDSEASS